MALIGPRQCGKTTLARELLQEDSVNYFDVEDPVGLSRLDEPLTALQDLQGLVVIDEIQRRPELFPVLRVLADRRKTPSKFLILGSASQDMLRQSSESLVKSPKLFFRDTGLLHQLMGLSTLGELYNHPKSGASWEGYVIEEVIRAVKPDDVYFWATHQGAEIDLILVKDAHLLGVECKRVDAPRLTPSMRIALVDLGLERIAVLYPGTLRYSLAERVAAVPLGSIIEGESGLFPDIFP